MIQFLLILGIFLKQKMLPRNKNRKCKSVDLSRGGLPRMAEVARKLKNPLNVKL